MSERRMSGVNWPTLRARWPAAIGPVQGKLALQAVTSLLIAAVVMRLLPWPRPYWLMLTALIVTANSFGETAAKSMERIVGTVLGLLVGMLVWAVTWRVPTLALAVVVGCLFAMFYERNARYRTVLFWLSVLLSLLLHLGHVSGMFYVARLADTLLGTGIAVLVTLVLLPVHTGDQAQALIAGLLDQSALRVRHLADALLQPGPRGRGGAFAAFTTQAEQLRTLALAEGVEATLLRRTRLNLRERLAACAHIERDFLYADEMLPLLPDDNAVVTDLLGAVAVSLTDMAGGVRNGALRPDGLARTRFAEAREQATAAYRRGAMTLAQCQATLRLLEAMMTLLDAATRLAGTAPSVARA